MHRISTSVLDCDSSFLIALAVIKQHRTHYSFHGAELNQKNITSLMLVSDVGGNFLNVRKTMWWKTIIMLISTELSAMAPMSCIIFVF